MEMENELGRELPREYVDFLKQTGGGEPLFENRLLVKSDPAAGIDICCSVDNFFGNGPDRIGHSNDLDYYGIYLMDEWLISTDYLLVADTESGMHECFVMNYYNSKFKKYSILYLETDFPDEAVKVADSFADFLKILTRDDY